jgi:hypothetical protein
MRIPIRSGLLLAAFALLTGFATPAHAGPILYGPTPYLQSADSPFNGVAFSYFHLETFEDGLFNTPGVTASSGVVNPPNVFVDSVDADDGVVNGSGSTSGYSFYPMATSLTFTFFDGSARIASNARSSLVGPTLFNSPTPTSDRPAEAFGHWVSLGSSVRSSSRRNGSRANG